MTSWARHYLIGNPFLLDDRRQCTPDGGYIYNDAVPYALRFWPQGGRRKRGGNVTVYLNDGVVDIIGNKVARASLFSFVKEWVH